jgi:glycosyltransferase involved in cell wall biosynthesis
VKVLHLSARDLGGGAFRGTYSLHRGLLEAGVDSRLLVDRKRSEDASVLAPHGGLERVLARVRPSLDQLPLHAYAGRRAELFSPAWLPTRMAARVAEEDPDLVHLHWVNDGLLHPAALRRIRKPLVWTLRDMWPFTGGCHYAQGCDGYRRACGRCPALGSSRALDLSAWVHARKRRAWADLELHVVAISRWLGDQARASTLFAGRPISVIPNGIDTRRFKPLERAAAREILGLRADVPLVVYGAIAATSDARKGFAELARALEICRARAGGAGESGFELLVFGAERPECDPVPGVRTHWAGTLHDDVALALHYAAADVVVVPSREEAFGKTAAEALACGRPVVAFGATGLLDVVEHERTGWLAKPFEPESLAEGIRWVLADPARRDALGRAARADAVRRFDLAVVARAYQALYERILLRAGWVPDPVTRLG